jgi:predicted phosphohydrolase
MDVFGERWANHVERIETAWQERVAEGDTVIIVGDTEWALHLADAVETLERIDSWPGRKVLVRGNHDYWWSSKTTGKVRKALPPTITALHNDSVQSEGFNICGAKGSPVPGGLDWSDQDAKLLNRECERLRLSLAARDVALPTIAALHYPPLYPSNPRTQFQEILDGAGVACCVYGHLHGEAGDGGFQGRYGRVEYRLVAADSVGFRPVLIARDGALAGAGDGARVKGQRTVDRELPLDDVRDLAEEVMDDKRDDGNPEQRTRELFDVPSEDPSQLAADQGARAGQETAG